MIGGAIGGLLFDPINYLLSGGTFETGVEVSRGWRFCILGASAWDIYRYCRNADERSMVNND